MEVTETDKHSSLLKVLLYNNTPVTRSQVSNPIPGKVADIFLESLKLKKGHTKE